MSIHDTITNSIIEAIETASTVDFVTPWHTPKGVGLGRPTNVISKKPYNGINVLALWATAMKKDYSTGTWATYNQWHELGAQVRKDEKSTHITFWKPLSKVNDKGEESSFMMAKAYYVFNADQVDGYEIPGNTLPVIASPAETLEHVEAFVAGLGAYIRHGLPRAYYNTALDYVNMPQRDVFTGSPTSTPTEAYYSTLFHELTHWTGHKSRLDRMEKSGQHEYAFEELVAELGAAFMCADLSVSNSPRPDHAAYIASWLKALKNDSKFIFTAASKAQKAADYLQTVKAQPVAMVA